MARSLAAEGVRVNAVAPGIVRTGIHASAGDPTGRTASLHAFRLAGLETPTVAPGHRLAVQHRGELRYRRRYPGGGRAVAPLLTYRRISQCVPFFSRFCLVRRQSLHALPSPGCRWPPLWLATSTHENVTTETLLDLLAAEGQTALARWSRGAGVPPSKRDTLSYDPAGLVGAGDDREVGLSPGAHAADQVDGVEAGT